MTVFWAISAMLLQPDAPQPVIIYDEKVRDVRVQVDQSNPAVVTVTSILPAGWTFNVSIDGNQDGVWGLGSGMPQAPMRSSPDSTFGQDSRNGAFCSQYIFTTTETDPTQIMISSQCGSLRSGGRVIQSGFDSQERVKITLEIPTEEFFGTQTTARLQACVWDTVRMSCQHRMPNLLTVTRRNQAATQPTTAAASVSTMVPPPSSRSPS